MPGLIQTDWFMAPGATLPHPVLKDDRESFPPAVVKMVMDWLVQQYPAFMNKPPTPQILYLGTVKNHPVRFKTKAIPELIQRVEFEVGTAEVLLRQKRPPRLILAAYHYLTARNIYDGRIILGPFLREEQRHRLEV